MPKITLLIAALCCAAFPALAAQLDIQVNAHRMAGYIEDGTILARGHIIDNQPHSGFGVWMDAPSPQGNQHYILSGRNNSTHQLHVRLEGEKWQLNDMNGKGIVLHSTDVSARFRIVADGNQHVASDSWRLTVQGATLGGTP